MKKLLGLLMLLFITGSITAQRKTITGKVINENTKLPMQGVNILANNQKGGSVTKQDGSYTITVNNNTSTLIFSYVGFASQTILIEDKTTINISMSPVEVSGDEVVVIGYGTQKKSSVTGAVSKYTNERLEETPNSRLDQALQGKIAGVQVQNISSEAGADPKVRVRGISSVSAGANPLVVVDGHPLYEGLSFVNMADVASVEVLKDAASAAIYGSRGANGVIIITTKSGKANKTKYGIKFSTGFKDAYELYPMMTTSEYTNMLFYEASLRLMDTTLVTQPTFITTNERAAYVIENTLMNGQGTNWQKQAIRSANVKNLQMNVSGGNSGVKYYISGGYQSDPGMMYHSEYERFTVKSKIDAQLSKKVKLGFNFNPSYIKRERPAASYTDFFRVQSYLPVYVDASLIDFVRSHPNGNYTNVQVGDFAQANMFNGRVYSGLMPDGSMWTTNTASNPFSTSNQTPKSMLETQSIHTDDYRALTSGDININIVKGLDFKSMASAFIRYSKGLDFSKRNSAREGNPSMGIYSSYLLVDMLSENTLTYNKKIKDHSFDLLAGFTVQKSKIREEQITASNYASDDITSLNTATVNPDPEQTFNETRSRGLVSTLGRILYGYKDKYLVNATFRADGSSYFGPGNKWGYFPSVSVGWVASNEKFMEKVDWLSNLKFRGSYGTTGNNNIQDYLFVDRLYPSNYPFGGTVASGQAISRDILSNPDITWELTNQLNIGADVSLFNNAVAFSADIYNSKTDKLLLQQATMGFSGVPSFINNIGRVQNKGIEFEITTHNFRKKDFKWTTSANISRNRNKILELGNEALLTNQGERTEVYINQVGGPLTQFFGYKTDGVWLSQAEINASGITGSSATFAPVAGGLKLVDLDGNKILDANDRTVIGNPYPDFIWGINNNLTYKNFDFSFFFQGVQGGNLINGDANYNETKRYNKNYNSNRWVSPMFPGDGKTPFSTLGFNWMLTDYVVEDASYFTLREILVGYTFPEKFTKRAKINSLRFYVSGQNLFFNKASGYRGLNPEARNNSGGVYGTSLIDGYQRGAFPIQKTIMFGLDFNF